MQLNNTLNRFCQEIWIAQNIIKFFFILLFIGCSKGEMKYKCGGDNKEEHQREREEMSEEIYNILNEKGLDIVIPEITFYMDMHKKSPKLSLVDKIRFKVGALLGRPSMEEMLTNLYKDYKTYAELLQKSYYGDYLHFVELGGAKVKRDVWNAIQKSNSTDNTLKLLLGCGQQYLSFVDARNPLKFHDHRGYITFDLDEQENTQADVKGNCRKTLKIIHENTCSEIVIEYLPVEVIASIIELIEKSFIKGGKLIIHGHCEGRSTPLTQYGFKILEDSEDKLIAIKL